MLADDPDAGAEAIPATIQALLAARIDRLEPGERAVLQRASVEGRLFHRGAVARAARRRRPTDGSAALLLALARKELVRPDRSLYEGDDAFRFNHVLIRDVAYASIPKELRAELHERLAVVARGARRRRGDRARRDRRLPPRAGVPQPRRARPGRRERARAVALRGRPAARRAPGGAPSSGPSSGTARSLLERACRAARGRRRPSARRCSPTSAVRSAAVGALDAADAAFAEAIESARRDGDEATELRAEIERAHRHVHAGAVGAGRAARESRERAIAVFEPLGERRATSRTPGS